MSTLVVTGTGYVGPDGGPPQHLDADGAPRGVASHGEAPRGVASAPGASPGASVPGGRAFLASGFDPVATLGRRTARYNHRSTLLAVAACGAALQDAALEITEANEDSVGLTLGTFCGSVTGSVDFGTETFAQPRPYNVNPAAFPNLVINAAAGAAAIHYGLRGANSTVVGGPVAGVNALRHAALTLRAGHADTMLAGASEEYGAHEAWLAATIRPEAVLGEAAAVLVLEHEDAAHTAGRRPLARVAAVLTRSLDGHDGEGLATLLEEALERAGVSSADVRRCAVRHTGDGATDAAVRAAAARLPVDPVLDEARRGDCYSAHAAVQLVETATAARAEEWHPHQAGVVLAMDTDGLAGVAVLTGHRAG